MKQAITIFLMFVLAGCSLGMPGTASDDEITLTDEPQQTLEEVCISKGYTWDTTDISCVYTQEGDPIIEIHYPIEWAARVPLIERTVDTYLANYRHDFDVMFEQNRHPGQGAFQLELLFEVHQHSEDVVSIQWNESFYTGGAHPGFGYTTFTFDFADGIVVDFEDLFAEGVDPLTAVMQPVRDALTNMQGEFSDAQFINDGTDDLRDYQHFVLTHNALVILFEPYAVAPGAAGPSEVVLPLSDYGDLLRPQYR